jgi:hypothetical protein
MKTKILLSIFAAGMMITTSCSKYPGDVERTQESLATITKYDVNANFTSYSTFYIDPSIYYKDGNDSGYVNNESTAVVINQIIKNMTDRGYIQVQQPVKPDLGIGVTMIKNTNVDVYYPYYPYWGYWGGGYYYPYYPYYPYVTTYSVGTIIIDMMDVKNSTNNRMPEVWSAVIRGLYTGTHTTSEFQSTIDQAFTQSLCFTPSN